MYGKEKFMKKVCSSCGKELKENELFCSGCGTKYVEPKEEKVTKETKTVTKTVAVAPVSNGKADLSIAGFVCSLVDLLNDINFFFGLKKKEDFVSFFNK